MRTHQELAALVKAMRTAQSKYFKHRTQAYLREARTLESQVDEELADVQQTAPGDLLDQLLRAFPWLYQLAADRTAAAGVHASRGEAQGMIMCERLAARCRDIQAKRSAHERARHGAAPS